MNEQRRASSFDELARGLASGEVSRRKAFGLLGAALLGGTLASIPGAAWATHRGRSHGPPSGDPTCPHPGQIRVCQCPSGQELCGGACVSNQCGANEQFDPNTCQCEPVLISSNVTCVCGDFTLTRCFAGACGDESAQAALCTESCASFGGLVRVGECTADCPG